MKEKFVEINFRPETLKIIEQANEILEEYQGMGLVLSLRQLYYQFVSKDLLANTVKNYDKLGKTISDARMAGYIDWEMLEDRGRFVRKTTSWESPSSILRAVAEQYKEDLWKDQPYFPRVFVEKDALVGVIEGVCEQLRISYVACRGYASQTMLYSTGKEFHKMLRKGKTPIILHLGDHDPSGLDMTRDNADKLMLFSGEEIEVKRLALNMDQVRKYNPPPNPAKESDSRFAAYKDRHGDESWELDALNPRVISNLIRSAVLELINKERWNVALTKEESNRDTLARMSDNWEDVKEYLEDISKVVTLTPPLEGEDEDEEEENDL